MNPRGLQFAAAALVALVAIWAGHRMYAAMSPAGAAGMAGMAAPKASAPEPEFGPEVAVPAPRIPDVLPVFSLAGRTGKATSIATWKDKSLIINFWATWCAPCRKEIPLLQSLATEWAGRDVEVIGIAVDHRDQVLDYADRFKITYPLLIGEGDALDAAAAFGFDSPVFPFTVFTDRRGEVVTLFVGELHQRQADLILRVVQDLNQKRLPLAAARHTIETGLEALRDAPRG